MTPDWLKFYGNLMHLLMHLCTLKTLKIYIFGIDGVDESQTGRNFMLLTVDPF